MFSMPVRVNAVLVLVCFMQSAYAQDSVVRRDIELKIREDQERLANAFWVKFKVTQSELGNDYASFVHVSGTSDTPAKTWFGEHAHAPNGKRFDYTSIGSARTDRKIQVSCLTIGMIW